MIDLLTASQRTFDGINQSLILKGYPPAFVNGELNPEYRFIAERKHIGTVWRWFPPGYYLDKVMFYYLPRGEQHEVWAFTDGRLT
jgi:hypothetical protein